MKVISGLHTEVSYAKNLQKHVRRPTPRAIYTTNAIESLNSPCSYQETQGVPDRWLGAKGCLPGNNPSLSAQLRANKPFK